MIQNSILDLLRNKCMGALTHQSLITLLCRLAGVPMNNSKEKTPPKLLLLVSRSKEGSTGSDTDIEEDNAGGEADLKEAEVSIDNKPVVEPSQDLIDPRVHKLI